MQNRQNSLADLITAFLLSGRSSRRFHQILREQEISKYEKKSVHVALNRMRRMGYTKHSASGWGLTKEGRSRANNVDLLSYISSPFKKETYLHNTFIAFDIPETDRRLRNWLRNQLKIFGYKMLQQSLWRGPGPLPVEFRQRLRDLGINGKIKTFTAVGK